jgi:hypothetical protein
MVCVFAVVNVVKQEVSDVHDMVEIQLRRQVFVQSSSRANSLMAISSRKTKIRMWGLLGGRSPTPRGFTAARV